MHITLPAMLSVKEAAKRCGLSKSTLDKLRIRGGGPSFSKLGRRVVYDPMALSAWIMQNQRSSTSVFAGAK